MRKSVFACVYLSHYLVCVYTLLQNSNSQTCRHTYVCVQCARVQGLLQDRGTEVNEQTNQTNVFSNSK